MDPAEEAVEQRAFVRACFDRELLLLDCLTQVERHRAVLLKGKTPVLYRVRTQGKTVTMKRFSVRTGGRRMTWLVAWFSHPADGASTWTWLRMVVPAITTSFCAHRDTQSQVTRSCKHPGVVC